MYMVCNPPLTWCAKYEVLHYEVEIQAYGGDFLCSSVLFCVHMTIYIKSGLDWRISTQDQFDHC